MTRTSTWMPFYGNDYLADTKLLSYAEHGGYVLLILEYWRAGPLPNDDAKLAKLTGQDLKEWRKIAPVVRQFFTAGEDGKLHHKRIDAERAKASDLSEKRRIAGSQRGSNGGTNGPRGGSSVAANAQQSVSKPEAIAEQLHYSARDAHGHAPEARASCAGGLQSPSPSPAAKPLASFQDSRAEQPRDAMARIVQPCLNDPPAAWMHLADRNPDGTAKVEPGTGPNAGCPIVEGVLLPIVASLLCDAAAMRWDWRGDWRPLIGWLREGIDFHDAILPAVQRVASRPRYQPPSTLRYFDSAVRDMAGKKRA